MTNLSNSIKMRSEDITAMCEGLSEPTKDIIIRKNRDKLLKVITGINAVVNDVTTLSPQPQNIFNAFRLTPVDKIRVVILGQDPFINPGEAHGPCFSVPKGKTIPPSTRNIFKCLKYHKLIDQQPQHGDLSYWASQGVLLLNCALTTVMKKSNAHADIWADYTDTLIKEISELPQMIIFILFGGFAQKKAHLIIDRQPKMFWGHPSPINTVNSDIESPKNFMYCSAFSKCNQLLESNGEKPIDWNVDLPIKLITNLENPAEFHEINGKKQENMTQTQYDDLKKKMYTELYDQIYKDVYDKLSNLFTNQIYNQLSDKLYNQLKADLYEQIEQIKGDDAVESDGDANSEYEESDEESDVLSVFVQQVQQVQPLVIANKVFEAVTNTDPFIPQELRGILWIFTDGGATGNGKAKCKASYAYYATDGKYKYSTSGMVEPVDIPGKLYKTSNQRAELTAIATAIDFALEENTSIAFNFKEIAIVSDSAYSIDCLDKWAKTWKKKQSEDKLNLDLVMPAYEKLATLRKSYVTTLIHIKSQGLKSHQSRPVINPVAMFYWDGNNIADKMCEKLLV